MINLVAKKFVVSVSCMTHEAEHCRLVVARRLFMRRLLRELYNAVLVDWYALKQRWGRLQTRRRHDAHRESNAMCKLSDTSARSLHAQLARTACTHAPRSMQRQLQSMRPATCPALKDEVHIHAVDRREQGCKGSTALQGAPGNTSRSIYKHHYPIAIS